MRKEGWRKVKPASKYAGVSVRTFRGWLKDGLRHSRLKTGTVLVSYTAIDEFLEQFQVSECQIDEVVDEIFNDTLL